MNQRPNFKGGRGDRTHYKAYHKPQSKRFQIALKQTDLHSFWRSWCQLIFHYFKHLYLIKHAQIIIVASDESGANV